MTQVVGLLPAAEFVMSTFDTSKYGFQWIQSQAKGMITGIAEHLVVPYIVQEDGIRDSAENGILYKGAVKPIELVLVLNFACCIDGGIIPLNVQAFIS
ncbi:hypothetical protein D3C76_1402530 [compost metagenome]